MTRLFPQWKILSLSRIAQVYLVIFDVGTSSVAVGKSDILLTDGISTLFIARRGVAALKRTSVPNKTGLSYGIAGAAVAGALLLTGGAAGYRYRKQIGTYVRRSRGVNASNSTTDFELSHSTSVVNEYMKQRQNAFKNSENNLATLRDMSASGKGSAYSLNMKQ